jgi:delta 1-pyrroline-5-carboxylate dehydrogenase
MTETLTHFIGGKQVSAHGALESINPSNTQEVIAKFPDGSPEDVNKAVEAARTAQPVEDAAEKPAQPAPAAQAPQPTKPTNPLLHRPARRPAPGRAGW